MTNTKTLTGVAIAAAAAGLFAMGCWSLILADDKWEKGPLAKVVSSCKGKSDCKGTKNSCKGQNSCKGEGFKEMTKEQCEKAKAQMSK